MFFISMYACMFSIAYINAKFQWQWSTWQALIFAAVAATIAGIPLIIFYFV